MSEKLTPMMKQYHAARRELPPGAILLFRLGDFYEMFFEDAREASAILNVALTKRGETPMCGIPAHSARSYIEKLVAAGKKVALCDQVGDVQAGKLVRRELTTILSAGSLDDFGLDARSHNFLASVAVGQGHFGLASADLSTGAFRVTECANLGALSDELARLSPAEVIVPEDHGIALEELARATVLDGYIFDSSHGSAELCRHFGVQSLDGFGCGHFRAGVGAAAALLHYLGTSLRRDVSHFRVLRPYFANEFLILDAATQNHLELVSSRAGREYSLLAALDETKTSMGSRLIRDWVLHPLRDPTSIHQRQDAIGTLLGNPTGLEDLRRTLAEIPDLERGTARLSLGSGNPRDLRALASALSRIPLVQSQLLPAPDASLLRKIAAQMPALPELRHRIEEAVVDEPPALLRDGGFIRDGFDARLDELRSASTKGKEWIASLQEKEIERTGIRSLKVRYTSVFGYFIEVTKANLGAVPEDYIRKQTTVNGERFITPELKEVEGKILGADERAKALEVELFQELRREVSACVEELQLASSSLAEVDALVGMASAARMHGWNRPVVDDSGILWIKEGRHPVLDRVETGERFIPNDTALDLEQSRLAVITGPNMAGKSTYIRQVALLVLMAQMGSYLPAAEARIGIADRIFTRVGASDDLAKGQSTFMVEMSETASILNNASAKSLVILDEIGRGTSTFDGLSIAWSVAEYLHDEVGARTLFATHYHELTDLERTCQGVVNLNVAVREWKDRIVFLRKIVPGRADQSYGIQVARLAGLPDKVLDRARQILSNLEKSELNADGKPALAAGARKRAAAILNQPELELFVSDGS